MGDDIDRGYVPATLTLLSFFKSSLSSSRLVGAFSVEEGDIVCSVCGRECEMEMRGVIYIEERYENR